MFYGLAAGKIDTGDLKIELVAASQASLNDRASRGELEATMISAAAYPYLRSRYVLARCGACFASDGGPVLAAREPMDEKDLDSASVAVPDATSSEFLALQLNRPGVRTRLLPADKVTQATKMGLADCALLARGDRDQARQCGLYCVADVAVGWARTSGRRPLPLTCLAIRNDLAEDVRRQLESVLRDSIRYGLTHRSEAAAYAAATAGNGNGSGHGAGRDPAALGLYVSETTVDMGRPGREAIEELLRRAHDAQIVPDCLPLQFVDETA